MRNSPTIDISVRPPDGHYQTVYSDASGALVDLKVDTESLIGYVKLTHSPQRGEGIQGITRGNAIQRGFSDLASSYSLSAYYWVGDLSYSMPLLIETHHSFYTLQSEDLWKWDQNITHDNLQNSLDGLNCRLNDAHVADILALSQSYICHACSDHNATFFTHRRMHGGFREVIHTLTNGRIGRMKSGPVDIQGMDIMEDVFTITVYWYSGGSPLLVHLGGSHGKWFRVESMDAHNEWVVMAMDGLEDETDDGRILEKLEEIEREFGRPQNENVEYHGRVRRNGQPPTPPPPPRGVSTPSFPESTGSGSTSHGVITSSHPGTYTSSHGMTRTHTTHNNHRPTSRGAPRPAHPSSHSANMPHEGYASPGVTSSSSTVDAVTVVGAILGAVLGLFLLFEIVRIVKCPKRSCFLRLVSRVRRR